MATYYFDNTLGDDSRSSSQAQSTSTPWKTMSKLNSFFSSLAVGDTIALKKGETWNETIIVNKSGTSGNPITITSYGSGATPIISGWTTIITWTPHPSVSGVYQSPVLLGSTGFYMRNVLFDGNAQEMGRFPNSGSFLTYNNNTGYVNPATYPFAATITQASLGSSPSWVGAELVIRRNEYVWSRAYVTSHNSGGVIGFTEPSNQQANDGWGFFFQNDIKTLDTLGDWYYDTTAKKLNVYFGASPTGGHTVKAACINELITINNFSYITIDGINFTGANYIAIRAYGASANNIKIQNCAFTYVYEAFGVGPDDVNPSPKAVLFDNNTVDWAYNCGVKFKDSSGVTITNNDISNVGLYPGITEAIWGDLNGVLLRGLDNSAGSSLVENNRIISSGYCGIFGEGDYININKNFVNSYCMTKADGGGIYWYFSNTMTAGQRFIQNNTCVNGIGTPQATNHSYNAGASGIYHDDNGQYMVIRDNTVAYNSRDGLLIHNCKNMTITGNTIFDNPYQVEVLSDPAGDTVASNLMTGNILANRYDTQIPSFFATDINDMATFFNTLNSNYYIDAYRSAGLIQTDVNGNNEYHDTISINTQYGWEASGITSPIVNPPLTGLSVVGGTKNGTTGGSTTGDVNIDIGPVTANKYYRVTVTVTSASNQRNLRVAMIRNGPTFEGIGNNNYVKARTTNGVQVIYMKCYTTAAGALLVFRGSQGVTYTLASLAVVELAGTEVDRTTSIILEYNETNATVVKTLAGTFVDHTNTTFAGSISLPAYSSRVLIKTSDNLPPVVTMGVTQIITLPTSTANLSGSATDADGSIAGYLWTKDSGPVGQSITSPTSASTTVTGLVAGTYLFRLTVTDNLGASTFGTQTVIVNNPTLTPTGFLIGLQRM